MVLIIYIVFFFFGPKQEEGKRKGHKLYINRNDMLCLLKTQHLTDTNVTRIWVYFQYFFWKK